MGHGPSPDPYKRLFETEIDGAVVLDAATGRILRANKAAAKIFGFGSPQEMVGLNPLDYAPEEDQEPIARIVAEGLEKDRPTPAEIRMRTKDERVIWVSVTGALIEHEGKKATLATIREITSEKAKDSALREAENQYERLFDGMLDGAVVLDVSTFEIVLANKAAAEIIGFDSPREVIGVNPLSYIPGEDRDEVARMIALNLEGKGPNPAQIRLITRDKREIWVSATATRIEYEGRTATLATLRDITADKAKDAALKAAEEKLKASEERFRTIIENASDAITILDENYNVTYESPSLARMTGYTPEEWVGSTPGVFNIHPDDLASLVTHAETLKSQPGSVLNNFTVRYKHKDGSWRWIEATGRNLLHDPKVKGLVVNFRDITDRLKIEEALKNSEERFRTLIEKATDVVIVLDATGKITYQSPSLERVTGYGFNEWVDKSLGELFIHPDDLPSLVSLLERILTQPGAMVEGVTTRYKHKDGSWHTLEATVTNMLHDPKVNGLVANFRDTTERKRTEEALRASEERNRLLVENANEAITVVQDAVLRFVNPKFAQLTGYAEKDLVGKPFVELVHPDDQQMLADYYVRRLKGEEVPQIYQFKFLNRAGNTRWAEINAVSFDWEGRPATLGLLNDITERRQIQEALRDSEAKYRRLFASTQTAMEVISMETGLVVLANEATARMFGFASADDLVGVDSMQFLRPEDVGWVSSQMTQAVADNKWQEIAELQVRTNDGRWLWISGMATQSEYQGKPALLISLLDITSRKRAEETLRLSEQKYRLLTERTNDVIWTTDLNLHNTYVSPSVERILGFTPEERLKHDVIDQMPPESLARAQVALLEHLALERDPKADPNRTLRIELEYYRKDGSTVWLENQVSGIRDADGTLIGLHGVARDISERRKVQQALRDSEAIYKGLFENTQTAMEVISAETGLVILANETTARMFGFASADDLIGVDSMEYLRPEDRDRVATEMAQALANKDRTGATEMSVRTKDGRWLWINALVTYTEYQGKTSLLISLIDLTSRKQAEETLRASEEKYRLLTEKTNDLIWTTDLDLRTTYVSPSVERIVGFTPEERLRQDATQQMTSESMARAQKALLEHLALERDPKADPQRIVRIELEYYRKDGSTIWLENQVSGIRDANGTLIGFHGVARDVTERRKTQQQLKESEERYRLLAENASDIIWVTDANLNITYASPSVTSLLGYGLKEILGRPFDHLLTPISLALMTQVYSDDMAGEQRTPGSLKGRTVEIEVVCKDGSTVWLEAAITPVRDEEGRFTKFQGACRNVTARRRVQEALKASEINYRNLFEHTLLGMEVLDGETGKVVLSNRSIAKMFGFKSTADMIGTNPMDYVLPEDREWVASQIAQLLTDPGWNKVATVRTRTEDGRIIWVTAMATPFDYEGKPSMLLSLIETTAAKEAQDKLQESEQKNRLLINNAAEGIAVVQDGLLKFVNPKCAEFAGRPADELISTPFLDIIHPEDRQMMAENYAKRVAGGDIPNNYQFRIIDKQGHTKWLQINAVRFNWEGREATLSMLSDITERLKAEQALKESEERYRLIADNVSDVIWVTDMNLKPIYISPSVARMLGYTVEQAVSGAIETGLAPASAQVALQAYAEAMAKEARQPGSEWDTPPLDLELVRGDGSTIWAAAKFSFLRAADGKPFAVLGVLRDITERKKADESLRKSEERFRGLVETTSDWVWEIDRNSRYTYVSPKAHDILGYEPQEMLGHTPYEFMHQREGRRVARIVKRFSAQHLPFSLLENTALHKNGNPVVLETSAVPILDSNGSFLGYRGIDRDITERKKVEQELQHSLKRLEKTMESTIEAITTTIETRDPYTTGHQMRVTDLACAIAKVMELPPTQIEGIRVAGLLHDIGKIAIPTEILSKPGRLNEVEYEMIKTHAKVGYNILKKIEFPWPVARSVLQHHERWNGSGYPHGIRGEDILVEARILAVADVMEAMASHRPYRPSVGLDKALDEITKNSGILYDPAVAKACVTAFTEAGFKFTSSTPGIVESGGTSPDHPVHSTEDR